MNDATNRKPMWLRIAQFPPLRLAVFGAVMLYMLGTSNKFIGETAGNPLLQIAVITGWSTVAFTVYIGMVRLIERRPVTELALPGMGRELGIGLLIGAGLYTACILILMVMGIYKIDGLNAVSSILPAIALPLSSGIFEELLFRGVLFRIVEDWLGSWISLVVSSLVFGLVHLMNPTATLTGAIFISVEAGCRLHVHPAAVDEYGLSHCMELHPVGHLFGHRFGRLCPPRPHQAVRRRPGVADRRRFRR